MTMIYDIVLKKFHFFTHAGENADEFFEAQFTDFRRY